MLKSEKMAAPSACTMSLCANALDVGSSSGGGPSPEAARGGRLARRPLGSARAGARRVEEPLRTHAEGSEPTGGVDRLGDAGTAAVHLAAAGERAQAQRAQARASSACIGSIIAVG